MLSFHIFHRNQTVRRARTLTARHFSAAQSNAAGANEYFGRAHGGEK